ncbi:MAG: hypothetical protein RRC34_02970 [Lentisphaeria bacterium]|nr:hypothetical protein [Lentisphaeria bacterium]
MIDLKRRDSILRLHTHPDTGSTFWRDRLDRFGLTWQAVMDHPDAVPPMTADDLRSYGIEGFLPRPLLDDRPYVITSETSGFSGQPVLTCFTESEFREGFVDPFIRQAEKTGFPLKGNWLWAGPSGPHIVGKALREIIRLAGDTDPFAVDFDPRWFKAQAKGALSARRYFDHILSQIKDIVSRQRIDVLYATPPVIAELAASMPDSVRAGITGVHYAGMAMSTARYADFHRAFPNAVHMSGYGNSLLGMFPEIHFTDTGIEYATDSPRLDIRVIRGGEADGFCPRTVGEEGPLMVSRYDESVLILNMLLDDVAVRTERGICNPHRPHHHLEGKLLY